MPSLLTQSQKDELEDVMENIHDTWKRKVVAFKNAKKIIMSLDPDFDSTYQRGLIQPEREEIRYEFEARIYYYRKSQDRHALNATSEDSLAIQMSEGEVRMKIKKEAFDFLQDAKRIDFDGESFRIASRVRPHGLFGNRFYTLTLKRVD